MVLLTGMGFGQNYLEQFDQLCEEGDTTGQMTLLLKWESEDPESPELLTSYFKYYFLKSGKEYVSLSTKQPKGESYQIKDSTGQIAGYFGSTIVYDPDLLQKGLNVIDKGIEMYPDRLDMRFGKIYVLGQAEEWEGFTNEIIKAIQQAGKNKHGWSWTFGEKLEDGEEYFLDAMQDYQLNLYETEDDSLLKNMRIIAEEILKLKPDHIQSITNIAITYILTGDFDQGIKVLQKAEAIDPNDFIVLSNIAYGYYRKGDIESSIKYYEKMLKLDNPDAVEFAKQKIETLKR